MFRDEFEIELDGNLYYIEAEGDVDYDPDLLTNEVIPNTLSLAIWLLKDPDDFEGIQLYEHELPTKWLERIEEEANERLIEMYSGE